MSAQEVDDIGLALAISASLEDIPLSSPFHQTDDAAKIVRSNLKDLATLQRRRWASFNE